MSKRHIFNAKPYAIDSPVALAPGKSAEVDDSSEIEAGIAAGILGENKETSKAKDTK